MVNTTANENNNLQKSVRVVETRILGSTTPPARKASEMAIKRYRLDYHDTEFVECVKGEVQEMLDPKTGLGVAYPWCRHEDAERLEAKLAAAEKLEAELAESPSEWKVPTCKIGNGVSAYDRTQVREYEEKVHRYILELENEVVKLRGELEELKKEQ